MAKLHELLAAEGNVAATYNAIAEETLRVLARPTAFLRETVTVRHFDEAQRQLDTTEVTDNTTTVTDRLTYSLGKAFASYINLLLAKDRTNQEARADVMLNGQVFLADVPATALLTLETRLGGLRKAFESIPTLMAGPVWEWDADQSMYRTATPTVTFRTKKTVRAVQLAPATDKHPAQVEKVPEDVAIASIERQGWSGMWTSRAKSDILARLDALLVAVKVARQRANRVDVVRLDAGARIASFLLNGPAAADLTIEA